MNKRGQTEQIFVYIFAIIVTALILYFGIKGIIYIIHIGGGVETANFITDIKSAAQKNYDLGYTSRTSKELLVPKNLETICFINPDEKPDLSIIQNQNTKNAISIMTKTKEENLYFNIKGGRIEPILIEHLKAKNGIQCKQGLFDRISLVFENKGNFAEVEIT